MERFALQCLFFLLIYCPDEARITIAPEEQNINKKFISERLFAPEERYINRKTP
jgi:hypothetical protein